MSSQRSFDAIVLGAGMVGVSTALHLQARGRSVALVDRRGAAEETSYGNAGVIQSEGVSPYPFPSDVGKILRYAINATTEANVHYTALPWVAPRLFQYWRATQPERLIESEKAFAPIAARTIAEHEALMIEAGVSGMMRRTGYINLYRTDAALDGAIKDAEKTKDKHGVAFEAVSAQRARDLEPHLGQGFIGGLYLPDPVSVGDPGAVGKAYADLFQKKGGAFLRGEARTLVQVRGAQGSSRWQVATATGTITARDCVVACGPWSDQILAPFGVKVPMFVKRGYHMHYSAKGNATLTRPIFDSEKGYVLAPMTKGIRLTTGAEFGHLETEKTPVQLGKVEPYAREFFPIDQRVEPEAWLGRRPCLPDMRPMIGPVPGLEGLWTNFGHQHWGFTMGPVTGRLLAEMMTGEAPFTDVQPFRVDRF
jgi:D-amino-acid dehydrogenase